MCAATPFSGSSRWVALGFSVWETVKALRIASANDGRRGDLRLPFRHRFEHGHDIDKLVGLLVHAVQSGLTGERDKRRMIHVGVGHTRQQIGRAGPEGRKAHAGPPGSIARTRRP